MIVRPRYIHRISVTTRLLNGSHIDHIEVPKINLHQIIFVIIVRFVLSYQKQVRIAALFQHHVEFVVKVLPVVFL